MDKYTPDELAHELWWGKLPEYQYEVNRQWLNGMFDMLKVGGVWVWPDTQRMFKKTSDRHFIEIDIPHPRYAEEE